MCLVTKMPDDKAEKWLAKQPDVMIAYKVVLKLYDTYYPPIFKTHISFGRTNDLSIIDSINRWPETCRRKDSSSASYYSLPYDEYVPYYHLFLSRARAFKFMNKGGFSTRKNLEVVKCKVNKKDITTVGWQGYDDAPVSKAIVSTSFEIVGEVK